MDISLIVAMSQNRVIGKDNQLPWHLPADLQHFKTLTSGHSIIMGRKTYESIGHPLPNRTNIILSRQTHYQAQGCLCANNCSEALALAKQYSTDDVFIIGGAHVFELFLAYGTRIYLTRVEAQIDGDTLFPEISTSEWNVVSERYRAADDKNCYPLTFLTLERITNRASRS